MPHFPVPSTHVCQPRPAGPAKLPRIAPRAPPCPAPQPAASWSPAAALSLAGPGPPGCCSTVRTEGAGKAGANEQCRLLCSPHLNANGVRKAHAEQGICSSGALLLILGLTDLGKDRGEPTTHSNSHSASPQRKYRERRLGRQNKTQGASGQMHSARQGQYKLMLRPFPLRLAPSYHIRGGAGQQCRRRRGHRHRRRILHRQRCHRQRDILHGLGASSL